MGFCAAEAECRKRSSFISDAMMQSADKTHRRSGAALKTRSCSNVGFRIKCAKRLSKMNFGKKGSFELSQFRSFQRLQTFRMSAARRSDELIEYA